MERISKTNFVAKANRKMEMLNEVMTTLIVMRPVFAEYNGKKIDKRFIDKANKIIKESAPHITISFATNYRGERENRFRLFFDNRYINEISAYMEYSECEDILYALADCPYIDNDTFKLNADNALKMVDKEYKIAVDRRQSLQECVERIDEIKQKYDELALHVKEVLNSIPAPLRQYISVTNPIY